MLGFGKEPCSFAPGGADIKNDRDDKSHTMSCFVFLRIDLATCDTAG